MIDLGLELDLPLIVMGAGGHAQVLIDALFLRGAIIKGVVDRDGSAGAPRGLPILAEEEIVRQEDRTSVRLVNGIGGIGLTRPRQELFDKLVGHGFRFARVIHPRATIAGDVRLDDGAQVMAGAIIQSSAHVGRNALINTGAIVDHHCDIGAHAHIAPGVTLSGAVRIGDGAHIGTGASIIQGINVGAGALVAAGSVVVADVPRHTHVMGTPAREIRR